jgi:hypothetical protein
MSEDNSEMNAFLLGMVGGRRPAAEIPQAQFGQPVPVGVGPELREDENKVMNRALLALVGGAPIDSR